MSAYVLVGSVPGSSKLTSILLSVLRMESPHTNSGPGMCALRRLTSTGKVALEAGLQLSVALAMVAVYLCVRAGSAVGAVWTRRTKPTRSSSDLSTPFVHVVAPGGSLYGSSGTAVDCPSPAMEDLVGVVEVREGRRGSRGCCPSGTGTASSGVDGAQLALPARLITAAVNFGLYIRGSQVCEYTGWQLPYVLLVGVLVMVPVVLPWVAAWSNAQPKPGVGSGSSSGRAHADGRHYLRLGVRQALVASFRPVAFWWEAALMAQRLVRGNLCDTHTIPKAISDSCLSTHRA
jgi:hypothetical protein